MENNLILVSDWEKVDKDDFYLSESWEKKEGKENIKTAKELQKKGELFYGYIVSAVSYAIYGQMDSNQVLINNDGDVIIHCGDTVINNDHSHREEYDI